MSDKVDRRGFFRALGGAVLAPFAAKLPVKRRKPRFYWSPLGAARLDSWKLMQAKEAKWDVTAGAARNLSQVYISPEAHRDMQNWLPPTTYGVTSIDTNEITNADLSLSVPALLSPVPRPEEHQGGDADVVPRVSDQQSPDRLLCGPGDRCRTEDFGGPSRAEHRPDGRLRASGEASGVGREQEEGAGRDGLAADLTLWHGVGTEQDAEGPLVEARDEWSRFETGVIDT